jgi:tetratricopeptide (TPR) repeat protein
VAEIFHDKELFKEVRKPTRTDGAAGPGLPAQRKYIKKAIEEFDLPPVPDASVLKRNLPDVDRLIALAQTLSKHGEKSDAQVLLRQALNINPYDQRAIDLLLEYLPQTQEGQVERNRIISAICQARPSFVNHFRLAQCLYDQGNFEVSRSQLDSAFFFPTEDTELLFNAHKLYGNIALQRADFESAEEFYNKAFSLNPNSATLLVNIGTLEVQRLDWVQAQDRFETAIELAASSEKSVKAKALVGLYLVSRDGGIIPENIELLKEALYLDPAQRTAVHLLCLWAHQNEEPEIAIESLSLYLQANPFDEEIGLIFAQFMGVQGEFETAELELEKIALWNPQNEDAVSLLQQFGELYEGDSVA